ncbi:hypothetical protein SO802_014426 [Lithocarpus litseifolius]|uniref:Uncharacterized protein n=1 Tax=Lithocarpus litseifolius TaxID=425828 RepID=A0AAW2CQX2_9ROSI
MESLRYLNLSHAGFGGLIPPQLGNLSNLHYLNLGGPIPVHLQNLTSLRHLDLTGNTLNSSIPDWLYTFSHLEFLNLGNNNLQGTISSSIRNLTSAICIDLSYNELEGEVPRSLGNLCNLREIRLAGNKWSQEISEIFQSLSGYVSNGLEILELFSAQLSRQLTDELGQFKNLAVLCLGFNSISGPIPWSIGNLSSLRSLNLMNNQINGTLPQSFGQLSKLDNLNIKSNVLEGVVFEVHFCQFNEIDKTFCISKPTDFRSKKQLDPSFSTQLFTFEIMEFRAKISLWLLSQKHLKYLDISNTRVSDVVPPLFWNLSSQFVYLNLYHNQIYGEIPNIPMILSTSSMFDMSSNHFNGLLPYISSNVSFLDLSDNLLSGSISHFLCYKMNESKQMSYLNLGKNFLSGEIIGCWMKWQNLFALNLGSNNLLGSIPTSVGSLIYLQSLNLYNNKFFGTLPSSLKNCKNLVTLDIGKNQFVRSIPSWIGLRFSSLVILSLHSNNFYGYIPENLCSLTSLQILDLSNNKLFGSIPRCVNNFIAMATNNNSNGPLFLFEQPIGYALSMLLDSALLVVKGKVLEYSTTLLLVKILKSMSSLTFLSHLNLSNNNLSGKIPLSTQLQSLSASCFIGNKLCGAPLIGNCPTSDVKPNVEIQRSKDFGGPEVDWIYVSVAVGFVVGFWVVLGPLLLNKQWRIVYFEFLDYLGYKLWGVVAQIW